MTVTVAALVTVNEDKPRALATYLEVTTPLLEKVGAKIRDRFFLQQALVGKQPAKTLLLVDYPDMAAVRAVFESPEYRALIPVRDEAFSTYSVTLVVNSNAEEAPDTAAPPEALRSRACNDC